MNYCSSACPSSTNVRLDDIALASVSPLVYPPMMMIALLCSAATATADLADDNDPTFFHDLLELSYILISAVVGVPLRILSSPPTTRGGDGLGTRPVC